jgi:hypothetical protein
VENAFELSPGGLNGEDETLIIPLFETIDNKLVLLNNDRMLNGASQQAIP